MMSIDEYLAQLKARKDSLQPQLSNVNTQMINIWAHYSQARSNFIFKPSPHAEDHQLKKLQPIKEKLQREILDVKAEFARIQALKKQGEKMMNS
jgi:hypothetical protein